MRDLWLAIREVALHARLFWRNLLAATTTVALPLVLLPLMVALNENVRVPVPGVAFEIQGLDGTDGFASSPTGGFLPGDGGGGFGEVLLRYAQWATPSLAAFGVFAACFAGLCLRLVVAREQGALKRLRAAPVPVWVHLAGRIGAAVTMGGVVASVMVALGVVAYDVSVPTDQLPAVVGVTLLASASFCALGMAATRVVPNTDAAPGLVFLVLVPLAFASNVFFPPNVSPDWLRTVADWLPLEPYVAAMVDGLAPVDGARGITLRGVAPLAAWMVGSVVLAARFFRWVPRHEEAVSRSKSRRRGLAFGGALLAVAVAVAAAAFAFTASDDDRPASIALAATGSIDDGEVATFPIDVLGVNLLVERTGDDYVGHVGGCRLAPLDDVDPDWLAAAGVDTGDAAVIDLCSAGGPVPTVPVTVRRGQLVVDIDAAEEASFLALGSDVSPPIEPPFMLHRLDGTVAWPDGTFALPATALVDYSQPGFVRIVGGGPMLGAGRRASFSASLETVGPLGATLVGLVVTDHEQVGAVATTTASLPTLWAALRVGESDVIRRGRVEQTATRETATSWRFRSTFPDGTEQTMTVTTDRALPPFGSLSITADTELVDLDLRAVPDS